MIFNLNNSINAVKEAKTLKPNEIINENIFMLSSAEYAVAIVEAVKYKTNYIPTKSNMTNIDIIEDNSNKLIITGNSYRANEGPK